MKSIKILGTGCPKCTKTFELFEQSVSELGLKNISVEKVEDIMKIMEYNIMTTPAVIIDGKVEIRGRVPAKSEVLQLLNAHQLN